MMNKNSGKVYSMQVSLKLDNIIARGLEINRSNILEAVDIKYKKNKSESESYDEFGFLDKYKDNSEIKK